MRDVIIQNGDIVVYPNGLCGAVSGFDEIIQRINTAASFQKGSFAYDRKLGLFAGEPDFDSDNIISTVESLINESLINTDVYVTVRGIRKKTDKYYAAITISDGVREKETEVKIYG